MTIRKSCDWVESPKEQGRSHARQNKSDFGYRNEGFGASSSGFICPIFDGKTEWGMTCKVRRNATSSFFIIVTVVQLFDSTTKSVRMRKVLLKKAIMETAESSMRGS